MEFSSTCTFLNIRHGITKDERPWCAVVLADSDGGVFNVFSRSSKASEIEEAAEGLNPCTPVLADFSLYSSAEGLRLFIDDISTLVSVKT